MQVGDSIFIEQTITNKNCVCVNVNTSAYINAHIKLYGGHIIVNNSYWQIKITTVKMKKVN